MKDQKTIQKEYTKLRKKILRNFTTPWYKKLGDWILVALFIIMLPLILLAYLPYKLLKLLDDIYTGKVEK